MSVVFSELIIDQILSSKFPIKLSFSIIWKLKWILLHKSFFTIFSLGTTINEHLHLSNNPQNFKILISSRPPSTQNSKTRYSIGSASSSVASRSEFSRLVAGCNKNRFTNRLRRLAMKIYHWEGQEVVAFGILEFTTTNKAPTEAGASLLVPFVERQTRSKWCSRFHRIYIRSYCPRPSACLSSFSNRGGLRSWTLPDSLSNVIFIRAVVNTAASKAAPIYTSASAAD